MVVPGHFYSYLLFCVTRRMCVCSKECGWKVHVSEMGGREKTSSLLITFVQIIGITKFTCVFHRLYLHTNRSSLHKIQKKRLSAAQQHWVERSRTLLVFKRNMAYGGCRLQPAAILNLDRNFTE